MTTSFRKVLRDLLNRPLRSALTILGIVVGVAGLLAIVATGQNLVRAQAAQLRETEEERARAVWRQRFGTPAATPQERARQMRFLAARGFSGDTVRRVLRGAPDGDGQ